MGTESPTFIQPIAQRADGIQAMFAAQSARSRKRSRSPPAKPQKKAKIEKLNAWEDDSDIEYLDKPPEHLEFKVHVAVK